MYLYGNKKTPKGLKMLLQDKILNDNFGIFSFRKCPSNVFVWEYFDKI